MSRRGTGGFDDGVGESESDQVRGDSGEDWVGGEGGGGERHPLRPH